MKWWIFNHQKMLIARIEVYQLFGNVVIPYVEIFHQNHK